MLSRVHVTLHAIDDPTELSAWLAKPIESWPRFSLTLRDVEIESDDRTKLERAQPISATERLARALYEMLGGPHRDDDATYFPPLPAIDEAANAVLQRAFTSDARLSIHEFWSAFATACAAGEQSPIATKTSPGRRTLEIPSRFAGPFDVGSVLNLTPAKSGCAPIQLVARRQFRLGRSLHAADFVTRFLPETPENLERTNILSRVHVVAEVRDDQLTLRDGNGATESLNGSAFLDAPLSAKRPLVLDRRGLLDLGQTYRLDVIPLFLADAWEVHNPAGWRDFDTLASPECGAVVFNPLDSPPLVRAVWLLNHIAFTPDESSGVAWNIGNSSDAAAAILIRSGCFFLANAAVPAETLQHDGTPVPPGEAVPLSAGQELQIGSTAFRVDVL